MPTIRKPLIVQFLRVGVVAALAAVAVAAIVVVEAPGERASAQAGSLPAVREPVANCGTGNVLTGRTQGVVDVLMEQIIANNVFGAVVDDCTDVIPFNMDRVRSTIDLRNKGLREIRSGDFAGLGGPGVNNAQIIVDLRGNELTTLPSDAFQGLGQVHTIRLSDNAISSLPANAFNDVKDTVIDLRLNGNELTTLPSGTLSGWSGLRQVHLNGNAITSLPDNTFDGNTSMTHLYLNDNFLKSDGLGFLLHTSGSGQTRFTFTSLQFLEMDDNVLTHDGTTGSDVDLPSGVFSRHTGLQTLSLQRNRLKTLPANAFTGLGSMSILRLNSNLIANLPSNAFTGLTGLTALGLNDNLLSTTTEGFDHTVFSPLTGLTSSLGLYVQSNGFSATEISAITAYMVPANGFTNSPSVRTAAIPLPTYPTRSAPESVANPAASTCGSSPLQSRSQWLVTALVAAIDGRMDCADVTEADLAGISTLSVTSGRIPGFTANDFAGMTRLRSLTLGGTADTTAILSLPTGLFSANTELRVLQLPYNYLTAWPTGALTGLTNLRELDLSYNQITSIPPGALASFTKLRVLNLRGNQIATVPDALFQGASSLRQLWLDGNPRTGLSIGHFAYRSLTSLRDLRVGTTLVRATAADQRNLESVLPAIGVAWWPAAVVTTPPATPTPTPTATPDPDAPTDPDATATSTPTRDERIELAIVSRIAPTVRTLSVTAGDRIRLEFSVWDVQDGRNDDLIQERNVPISWSDDDGAGTFTEFGGSTTNGNGAADDRVVIYTAPSLPGRYVVTAAFVQTWRCSGAATDCAATFTVNVQRAAVAATAVPPCPTTGPVPGTIADAEGAQYAAVTPAEGGRFDDAEAGIYVTVPSGALPGCDIIGIRMYSLGPSSAYMSGVRTVLAGNTYRVAAVNRSTGQPLEGFQMAQPARVCVPLPDMFRQNLTGVNMVRHVGDVASPLTSAIVSDDVNGLSVCGNVSLLPSEVTVAGPSSAAVPTPAPTPSVDSELPEAGGGAPSYAWVLLALLIGILGLTGISRIRRITRE